MPDHCPNARKSPTRESSAARYRVTRTHPRSALLRSVLRGVEVGVPLDLKRTDNLVRLNVVDLGHHADVVDDVPAELACVPLDVPVVDVGEPRERVCGRVSRVHVLDKVHVVRHKRGRNTVLEHDDIRVVYGPMGVLLHMKRGDGHPLEAARRVMVGGERGGRRQRHSQERKVKRAGHRPRKS